MGTINRFWFLILETGTDGFEIETDSSRISGRPQWWLRNSVPETSRSLRCFKLDLIHRCGYGGNWAINEAEHIGEFTWIKCRDLNAATFFELGRTPRSEGLPSQPLLLYLKRTTSTTPSTSTSGWDKHLLACIPWLGSTTKATLKSFTTCIQSHRHLKPPATLTIRAGRCQ